MNMSKSAKGTLEKNGKNVAQKSGLNSEILNQGWGTLFRFLEYKGQQRGVEVIRVTPQGTSQICSSCDHKDSKSRSGKHFECTECGFKIDADINGAKNILTRGQRGIAGLGILIRDVSLTPELETTLLESSKSKRNPDFRLGEKS
jgi:transposase